MKKFSFILAAVIIAFTVMGCKPYDKPEYVEVGTNEVAFYIPLFTDDTIKTEDQAFINQDEDFYKSKIVNEKLIPITHRWIKTGRMEGEGYYTPSAKIIKVSTATYSGKWLQNTDEAIKVETSGSQGVQIPITYTFTIKADDAALFLASNNGSSDVEFAFTEMVNKYFANYCNREFHKVAYKDVNKERDTIIDAAVAKTTEFAKEKGITIITMGVYDGLIFDDKSLQDSIDKQAALAAQVEIENQQAILLQKQRDNAEYEENTRVRVANISANTYKIEQDKLDREQARANTKILAEAQAEAIKTQAEKGLPGANATTFVITDHELESLGLGDLMRRQ